MKQVKLSVWRCESAVNLINGSNLLRQSCSDTNMMHGLLVMFIASAPFSFTYMQEAWNDTFCIGTVLVDFLQLPNLSSDGFGQMKSASMLFIFEFFITLSAIYSLQYMSSNLVDFNSSWLWCCKQNNFPTKITTAKGSPGKRELARCLVSLFVLMCPNATEFSIPRCSAELEEIVWRIRTNPKRNRTTVISI